MSTDKKRSWIAVFLTSLYLLTILFSLVLMVMTAEDTAVSGIFLVIATMPWAMVLSPIQSALQIDSMIFSTVFLLSGGLFNTIVLYHMLSFVLGGFKN